MTLKCEVDYVIDRNHIDYLTVTENNFIIRRNFYL